MTKRLCETLGIRAPRLEDLLGHREAGPYALLLAALLERGEPMTLEEAAARLSAAGAGPAPAVLASLKRCRPAQPPIYRDGARYSLDPHDEELELWLFRLDLMPPRAPLPQVVRPAPAPLPGPEQPLAVAELEEAWRGRGLHGFAAQRLAQAVLDAHRAPMAPSEVVAFLSSLTRWHSLHADAGAGWRLGLVRTREDGRWELVLDQAALRATRQAVREQLAQSRAQAAARPDPEVIEASQRASEARRAAHAAELARLRRAILVTFPVAAPRAVTLLDLARRELSTFLDGELEEARSRLRGYDLLAGVGVREALRALGLEPGGWRLDELGPPQKSMRINSRGRTLKITLEMIIRSSCGLGRPLGDRARLAGYLEAGKLGRLRERLEADAKALHALYSYGRLHGCVRLRWGFLDEVLRVPWLHWDEGGLHALMKQAHEEGRLLEVVRGFAPGWAEPWARLRLCQVVRVGEWSLELADEEGYPVDRHDVQLARLAEG